MKNYLKLQNGSDIRGIAMDGVKDETPNLTPEEAENIAVGFVRWLREAGVSDKANLRIAVGRDPRLTGGDLLQGLARGFSSCGVELCDCGPASTPAMFMATIFEEIKCDGAVMITASHLPFNRNGFKFFTASGGLDKQDIADILRYAAEHDGEERMASEGARTVEMPELMELYCAHLRNMIIEGVGAGAAPLEGMKIVVDAGNGGGGFFASQVLEPLGADISSSQYLEPDGTFPNHAPNPEDDKALAAVSLRTSEAGADIGLIFDTDVDRSAAVDEKGRQIARNGIVAMAAALTAEDHPATTVVTDSITSRQLTSFLEDELGLKHLRYRRGYRNVINKAIELNEEGTDCQLAIETSGHAAFKENFFLDDGAYLAVKIVIKAAQLKQEGKPISYVLRKLEEPADEQEIRIPIKCENFSEYGARVLEELEQWAEADPKLEIETPNYEGVRINFPSGWCLLRKSLHDPILPMNVASDKRNGCGNIVIKMDEFLRKYDKLEWENPYIATKDSVLAALRKNRGKFISGGELSRELDVSRTAVWKAIKALREEGCPIEAVTNRGYMLAQDTWGITEESLRTYLPAELRDIKLHVYDTLESTNLTAKQLVLEGAAHGTVVMAKQQTSGRGRLGRSFFSPREGIYMSIILKPTFDVSRSVLVTAAAAVAVAEAVDEVCGQNAQIKWVNDVYVDGRKVCGILTEGITDFETGQIDSLILGIGINTSLTDFPEDLLDIAGAVDGDYSRPALAAAVIAKALTFTDHLDKAEFMPAYKERSLVIGRDVTVYQGKYKVNPEDEVCGRKARVLDIDNDGGLVVLYADGTQEKLVSGEITIRL